MKKHIEKAVQLYESFREKTPRKIGRINMPVPKAVACIGYVEALDYRTTHAGKATLYTHKFVEGSRPLFAVSADGKQLLMLGGRFKFTERGIVDHDKAGKEIENAGHGKNINPKAKKRGRGSRDFPAGTRVYFNRWKSEPGKGLSYSDGEGVLADSAHGSGWDVVDLVDGRSIYTFSIAYAAPRDGNPRVHGKCVYKRELPGGEYVEIWWDRNQSLYTIQHMGAEGYEIGGTQYAGNKTQAVKVANLMIGEIDKVRRESNPTQSERDAMIARDHAAAVAQAAKAAEGKEWRGKVGPVEVVIFENAGARRTDYEGAKFRGHMEHDERGELGGLWFDAAKRMIDYDGLSSLSPRIVKAIRQAGFTVPREFE